MPSSSFLTRQMYPRVSVIIPAYNVSAYILDALVALQKQTFQDFEALVVDDGSSDNTAELVHEFCQTDPRFRLLRKKNGGLSSARNYGIRHAKGEYIALLDGDDCYEQYKLETHVYRLDSSPDIGVVYSASRAIRDDGKPTFFILSGKPIFTDPLAALLCKNFIGHGSNSVFRKCLIAEVGEFDETLPSSEDLDFWLRVANTQYWRFYRESKVHCFYRVRPSSLSFNIEKMRRCNERVIEMATERNPKIVQPLLPKAYAYMYRYLARTSLISGNSLQAREFIHLAIESDYSIFLSDPRSLLTLISVCISPIASVILNNTLGATSSSECS